MAARVPALSLRSSMTRSGFPGLRRTCPPGTRIASVRQYRQTTVFRHPTKGAEGRDEIKAETTEYSKSGSDDAVAHSDAAFDANKTKPETAKKSADGKGDEALEVSPAEPKASKQRPSQEGGAEASAGESHDGQSSRQRTSGKGSPAKEGKTPSGS